MYPFIVQEATSADTVFGLISRLIEKVYNMQEFIWCPLLGDDKYDTLNFKKYC